MVIFNAVAKQQFHARVTDFPPRSNAWRILVLHLGTRVDPLTPSRWLPTKLGQELERLVKNIFLLLITHIRWIFVRVSMQTDFVTRIANCRTFLWKSLESVAWDKPCGFDFVFVEKFQYTCCSVGASKKTFILSASQSLRILGVLLTSTDVAR